LVNGLSSARSTSRSASSTMSSIMMMMIESCDHSFFLQLFYKLLFICATFETIYFYSCFLDISNFITVDFIYSVYSLSF
jgi:hypothetical protein